MSDVLLRMLWRWGLQVKHRHVGVLYVGCYPYSFWCRICDEDMPIYDEQLETEPA